MLMLRGHEGAVRCFSYAPDGCYLASGSEDKTARLWDLTAGATLLATFQHPASVEALAFHSGGKGLITGTAGGHLFAWDLPRKRSSLPERAHIHGVRCMTSISDAETLLTAGWDHRVRMWEVATLKHQGVLVQESACTALAFCPVHKTLAVGSQDGRIHLYAGGTLKGIANAEERLPLFALAWSPDGRILASGHADGTIRFHEGTKRQAVICGHTWTVYSLAFTPDSRTLVSGGADGTVRLWNVQTGRERCCYRWHTSWVTCLSVAPDGMTAAAGSADHTIVIWDLENR